MSNKNLEAAPYGTAEVLLVLQAYKTSSGTDLTENFKRIREICEEIKSIPITTLYVALKIYRNKLTQDAHTHPNYFINTAKKLNRNSKIKKRTITSDEGFTDIGKVI